jgi:DNA replication protein DnaC
MKSTAKTARSPGERKTVMGEIKVFPRTQPIEECPTCKTPLEETSHGWVREHSYHEIGEHGHSERCSRKFDFCLIPCPMCSGGVEAKRLAQTINMLFSDSNIPAYAKDWTFNTFPEDADHKALFAVQSRLSDWLAGAFTKGGLYLVGKNGQCKTSLAIAALHAWLRKGHSGVFIGTSDLFGKLKDAIAARLRNADYQDRYEASQGAKLIRLVKSVELLILDDLGVEHGSPYEIRELYLILEARRSHGLYTIFTSNRDAKDLEQYWRSETGVFQDTLRIIGRLGEYAFAVPVAGRNQRERKG